MILVLKPQAVMKSGMVKNPSKNAASILGMGFVLQIKLSPLIKQRKIWEGMGVDVCEKNKRGTSLGVSRMW